MNDFRFREVSIVPQYAMSAMNPTRKIGAMIQELLEARGVDADTVMPELERRLDLVGLSRDVLERYPIELSGGMKQRMVMVISTLLDPSLLIADEITSALDVSSQKAVAETLVQFRDHGFVKSMIVITHDISILYQIADTITVMYAGKLAEKASTDVLIERAAPSVHAAAHLVAAGGRRPVRGATPGRHPGQPAVTARSAAGLSLPGPLSRWRSSAVSRSRRSWRSSPTTSSPAGRRRDMLTLDRVSKVYKVGTFGGKELTAVRDVSFDVDPGEVVSLIGESGCGKTTIGRMILRLLSISSGSIAFGDRDIATLKGADLKAYYRKVQGVFQDPVQLVQPDLQGRPRLRHHPGRVLRRTLAAAAWDDKLAAALDAVNLDAGQVLHKYPHQLSGGQLQRLLVARALLLDIEFLVADEIISMLDASTRIDVLNLLGDLKARGLGILFITHDLSLGNYISERTVILRRGRVVEKGATEKVFGNPLHPYTRMLLAAVPHLHERWSAAGVGRAPIAPGSTGHACITRPSGRHPTAAGSPSLFAEVEAGHLVACAHVDDPAGCPEARPVA